jgi:DNA-binding transcriptional LysR family regulator
MEFPMELRHLRYFVAVAEEGSLTNAAERRLHTAQPSLSRQIRDLELEVGVKLLERGARGIELTAAGRTFLDHARLALLQVEAAGDAARRVAQPAKAVFVVGFLTGAEVVWLPEVLRILREEQPGIEITLSSQSSPDLAGALMRAKVDVAFLRREALAPGLAFKFLIKEPLVAVLPKNHRLAAHKEIKPQDTLPPKLTSRRLGWRLYFEGCHRRLCSEVRHHVEARIRRREFVFRDVVGGVHRWRDSAPALRAESTVILGRHTPIAGAAANDRSGHGLQPLELLAAAEAVSGEIGRTGEEGRTNGAVAGR